MAGASRPFPFGSSAMGWVFYSARRLVLRAHDGPHPEFSTSRLFEPSMQPFEMLYFEKVCWDEAGNSL
jgi:hypothetical protein